MPSGADEPERFGAAKQAPRRQHIGPAPADGPSCGVCLREFPGRAPPHSSGRCGNWQPHARRANDPRVYHGLGAALIPAEEHHQTRRQEVPAEEELQSVRGGR